MTAVRYTTHPGAWERPAHSIDTPQRLDWATDALQDFGAVGVEVGRRAGMHELGRAHDSVYLTELQALSQTAIPARLDPELIVDQRTFPAAQHAAGALIDQVDAALADPGPVRVCLSRPGSHHASRDYAMGFCVVNNLAVAAHHALNAGLERVAILDFDVHHGNGTQQIFWRDGRVLTVSMHQSPFFPGTGAADEIGAGAGRGLNLNLPLSAGRDGRVAVPLWQRGLDACVAFEPQLVLVQAGLDAHVDDWTSDIHLADEDFLGLGERTGAALAALNAAAVFELGGGYTQPAVHNGLTAFLEGLTATRAGKRP